MALGLLVAALVNSPDQWVGESGPAQAKAVIERCMADTSGGLSDPNVCIRRALGTCEDEHGTYQRAMNDCATFSRLAWENQRASVSRRLMGAKQAGVVFEAPEPHVALLKESEQRWDAWNRGDCEMQARFSEGGTFHRFALDICLSDHAAYRALELEALAQDWEKIFKLDDK